MLLSVIIVNYNVKNLLKDCLNSVLQATSKIEAEIWVVDNSSVDGSVEMLQQEFPEVNLIANKENVGFAKANNQAIKLSNGEFLVLLNPDTVVYENTFNDCFNFEKQTENCGGIGVKMVNKDGQFLTESKRGFPTPWASFCRLFYLSKVFPKSAFFNSYYLGHLDQDKYHKVDILAGAFIFVKKQIAHTIGGLNENYFMFGEDVEFSYEIKTAGFQNYYLGTTSILHYKGESTKKKDIVYINRFYGAMKIFSKKYYPKSYPIYWTMISLIMFLQKIKLKFNK